MSNGVHEISIALGNTPPSRIIKSGQITCPRVQLNFSEFPKIHRAFPPMVREQAFDVSEMAVVTFFQALDFGKPLRLLPVVLMGNMHHGSMFYNPANGPLTPQDLKGRRVGVRAYTQTTGAWVRGVLQEQYGVDLDEVTWVTTEEAHVAEYKNPSNVEMIQNADLPGMLRAGEVSAIIAGPESVEDTEFQPLIPDAAAAEWYAKHKTMMINHMVVVTEALLKKQPAIVQDIYNMLRQGVERTRLEGGDGELSAVCCGMEKVWGGGALQLAMKYALEQRLISRIFDKKELFAEVSDY